MNEQVHKVTNNNLDIRGVPIEVGDTVHTKCGETFEVYSVYNAMYGNRVVVSNGYCMYFNYELSHEPFPTQASIDADSVLQPFVYCLNRDIMPKDAGSVEEFERVLTITMIKDLLKRQREVCALKD